MSDELATHREAMRDALTGVRTALTEVRGEVTRVTREVDTGLAKVVTRVDAADAWRIAAETRLRDLETTLAKQGVYFGVAAALISAVVSLITAIVVRAVMR